MSEKLNPKEDVAKDRVESKVEAWGAPAQLGEAFYLPTTAAERALGELLLIRLAEARPSELVEMAKECAEAVKAAFDVLATDQ